MPNIDGLGFSDSYTRLKQHHYRLFTQLHATIFRNIATRHDWVDADFLQIDLTAGQGESPSADGPIPGSPVIATEVFRDVGLMFEMVLFERHAERCQLLRSALYGALDDVEGSIRAINADYTARLPEVLRQVKTERQSAGRRGKTFGLVYLDPTGTVQAEDIEALREVNRLFPCVDILINVSGTGQKRALKSTACRLNERLMDQIARLGKTHWLIRKPYTDWQWTFLFGTNWKDFPRYRAIDMYPVDSPQGGEFVRQVNYTKKEMSGQPALAGMGD